MCFVHLYFTICAEDICERFFESSFNTCEIIRLNILFYAKYIIQFAKKSALLTDASRGNSIEQSLLYT